MSLHKRTFLVVFLIISLVVNSAAMSQLAPAQEAITTETPISTETSQLVPADGQPEDAAGSSLTIFLPIVSSGGASVATPSSIFLPLITLESPTSDLPPTVTNVTIQPIAGSPPLLVNFNAEIKAAASDTLTYTWSFGDETAMNGSLTAPVSGTTIISTSHEYKDIGEFAIVLTVFDSKGRTGRSQAKVRVELVTTIRRTTPANEEINVSVTRESVLEFSAPLNPATVNATVIRAEADGKSIPFNLHLSRDNKMATLFYEPALPANARITVTVNGDSILNEHDQKVDADRDGQPGGVGHLVFTTLNLQRVSGTDVWGYVYDSYSKNPDGTDIPIVGATIRVDGFAEANAVTDKNGYFILKDMPAPIFFVHIDGSTATNPPDNSIYATVGKAFHSVAGLSSQLTMDGSFFNVYLPPMNMGDMRNLKSDAETDIPFGAAGKEELKKLFPDTDPSVWARTVLRVPAKDAISEDGTPATQAAIIPVPSDRLPAPLPPGVNHLLDIAVVAPGATNFDVPAPVCFPNLPQRGMTETLPSGAKTSLVSFNHDTGMWESVGQMTVSPDGLMVCTDPGVGVRAPGWHYAGLPANDQNTSPYICPLKGKPIDLASGLESYQNVDLEINSPRGWIGIVRRYRSGAKRMGPFGIGGSHNYDYQLGTNNLGSSTINLIVPEGNEYPFVRQSDGTLINSNFPDLNGAVMTTSGDHAFLRWKDGTVYEFESTTYQLAFLSRVIGASVLVGIIDPNGNKITLTRNSEQTNQLLRITEPSGRFINIRYTGSTMISAIEDSTGRTVRYEYDCRQGGCALRKVIDQQGQATFYEYLSSSSFNQVQAADANAQIPITNPDRLRKVIDARGVALAINRFEGQRIVEQLRPDGGVWKFDYTLQNPDEPTSKVIETKVTDPTGQQETYRFNPDGYVIEVIDSLGRHRTFEREGVSNRLLALKGDGVCDTCGDPATGDQIFGYGNLGNLTSVTDALGNSSSIHYESTFNKPIEIRNALGYTTTLTYDDHGNLQTVTDANQHTTRFIYNQFGQPSEVIDPLNVHTFLVYDTLGNLEKMTDALNHTTKIIYDGLSRPVAVVDALGHTSRIVYDSLDRVTSTTDALGNVTRFGYDAVGNMLSVIDAKNHKTSFVYDLQGRLESRTTHNGRVERYTYNSGDLLTQYIDRRGQTSNFNYDDLGRLVKESYQDGSSVSYSYDEQNRLVHVVDTVGGNFDFTYDEIGRMLSDGGPIGTVEYSYDAIGQVRTRQVVGQTVVDYLYGPVGNLLNASMGSTSATFTYDVRDQMATISRSNGVVTEHAYDQLGQLLSILHRKDATTLAELHYSYDAIGNRSDYTTNIGQPLITQPVTRQYDEENRLISSSDASGTTTYSYDENGNLTRTTAPSGTTTYTWDVRNRLASINLPNGETIVFRYDFAGNMIAQTTTGSSTTTLSYVLDNLTNVAAMTIGNQQASVLTGQWIDQHLAIVQTGGQEEFALTDGLNSTVATVDNANSLQGQFIYEPFGQTTARDSDFSFQYTGRVPVSEGLYYYRARFFETGISRFISEDPVGFIGGDINLFLYTTNNPLNNVDPTGLFSFDLRKHKEEMEQIVTVGPIDAWNAKKLAEDAKRRAEQSGLSGPHNGAQDAFRHCLWSCEMSKRFGRDTAIEIGDVHEACGVGPARETEMDLRNNAFGSSFGQSGTNCFDRCFRATLDGSLQTSP